MPKSKCPVKWKPVLTQAEARRQAKAARRSPTGRFVEAFQCPEGHWHVGSGFKRRVNRKGEAGHQKGKRRHK